MEAANKLAECGVDATVLRLMRVWPLPVDEISKCSSANTVVVIEETCTGSGIRETLAWELHQSKPKWNVSGMDLGSSFVPHGSMDELYRHTGLDAESISNFVREVLDPEN